MLKKADEESWVDAIKKYDSSNSWVIISFKASEIEYLNQKIYPQEREEIKEWARKADAEHASWLGNVFFIPFVEPRNSAEYAWSALNAYSLAIQNPILDEFRKKLAESAKREAEVEKMRLNSQYIANNFKKFNSSNLSEMSSSFEK